MNLETEYPVMEQFYTIQGEGFFTGLAAYFVRLGGCDVGCVWCDVKESWDANNHPKLSVKDILIEIKKTNAKICVITGGEPAMYDLTDLIYALKLEGIQVNIETSGAYPIIGNPDWICLSPKKFKFPIDESLKMAHEFKAVVFHPSDIQWAQTFVTSLNKDCKLFLQPEWSKEKVILPQIIDFVKHNTEWRISLQTHKYMDIP